MRVIEPITERAVPIPSGSPRAVRFGAGSRSRGRFAAIALALFGFLGVGTAPASAQCLAYELQKLTASDAFLGDHF